MRTTDFAMDFYNVLFRFVHYKAHIMSILRTFIAIEIPVSIGLRNSWADLKMLLKDDRIRWVNNQTLHITLFFLGATPEEQVGELKLALTQKVSVATSFPVSIKGMGTFGAAFNPKVIWIGVERCEPLLALHEAVSTVVETFGFQRDQRGFNPHITLGRVTKLANPAALSLFMNRVECVQFLTHKVTGLAMYQSTLTPNGSIYKPLWNIPLLGNKKGAF